MCLCMILMCTTFNYIMHILVRNNPFRDGFFKLRIMPNNTSAFLKPVFSLFGCRCVVLDGGGGYFALFISWLVDNKVSLRALTFRTCTGRPGTLNFFFVISMATFQIYGNLAEFILFCLFVWLILFWVFFLGFSI